MRVTHLLHEVSAVAWRLVDVGSVLLGQRTTTAALKTLLQLLIPPLLHYLMMTPQLLVLGGQPVQGKEEGKILGREHRMNDILYMYNEHNKILANDYSRLRIAAGPHFRRLPTKLLTSYM